MTDPAPFEDPFAAPIDHPLIGRRVVVIMDHDDPAAKATGVLVGLNGYGESAIDTADGRRYCWPAVEIRQDAVPSGLSDE